MLMVVVGTSRDVEGVVAVGTLVADTDGATEARDRELVLLVVVSLLTKLQSQRERPDHASAKAGRGLLNSAHEVGRRGRASDVVDLSASLALILHHLGLRRLVRRELLHHRRDKVVVTLLALMGSTPLTRCRLLLLLLLMLLLSTLLQLSVLTLGLLVWVRTSLIAELLRLQVGLVRVLLCRIVGRVLDRAQLLGALIKERVHVVTPARLHANSSTCNRLLMLCGPLEVLLEDVVETGSRQIVVRYPD